MQHKSNGLFVALAAICSFALATTSLADRASDEDISRYAKFLGELNRYSPIEGAGSHGTIGYSVGLGMGLHTVEKTEKLHQDDLGLPSDTGTESSITMPGIVLIKGLFSPIDGGLTIGTVPSLGIQRAGAHLQWTVYEEFQRPALAIRGNYSRLFGLANTKINSGGLDLIGSYGFSIVSAYAGTSIIRHDIAHTPTIDNTSPYTLTPESADDASTVIMTQYENAHLFGLAVRVVPPYVTATAEMQLSGAGVSSYMGKLSMGM